MTAQFNLNQSTGLSDEEVLRSRAEHGENVLTPPQRPSWWHLYLEKFNDPVIRVLLVAALLSLCLSFFEGGYAETIGIFAAILLATGIGFLFEYDANRKFDLLNSVRDDAPVKVMRNGQVHEVTRREVVVGDVVLVETGDEVPADGVLLEAVAMQVNESCLTGEPVTAKTTVETCFDPEATYASNRLLRGTTVVDGHGALRVEQVGDATEIGTVARQSMEPAADSSPLDRQLTRLAALIGKVGFTVAASAFLVFFIKDVLLHYDFATFHNFSDWMPALKDTLQYFMMAVTLIVVAVPEGLPMSVTLSLALNMRRMLTTHNLVRKLHACETMGAITVICTDKTGTLTQNLMAVHDTHFYGLPKGTETDSYWGHKVVEGLCVNTTAFLEETTDGALKGVGNPTEVGLLRWLHAQGHDYLKTRTATPILHQITFSTERKYMATLVRSAQTGERILYVKGAPEVVWRMCSEVAQDEGTCPAAELHTEVEHYLHTCQQQALRTLGFACKVMDGDDDLQPDQLTGMTFLGVAALSDPVRPDVPEAVARCRKAGIEVVIVTGDTPGTAIEIARRIGLWTPAHTASQCLTGAEFAALSDEEALERVKSLKIMSRARPSDKQRLVRLLQQLGAVVAVTGDGTNDAPALHRAEVGLSMGSGTSVAKEASDITLLDDSFRSIGTAVMWGRSLYRNIQRFILFQLTINFVALFIVLAGAWVGTELPLTVTQMLWVNLIMDTFAALALASTPPDEAVMREHPRRATDFIITPSMRRAILGPGLLFAVALMAMLLYFEYDADGLTTRRLTLFFTFFVLLQLWNLFNARVFGTCRSAFHDLRHSYGTMLVVVMVLVGQFLIVEVGGSVFRTVPLSALEWLTLISTSSMVLWAGELLRGWQRHKLRKADCQTTK